MSGLCELLSPYRTISIIGMSKNAGKTTVLNHLIQNFHGKGISLALTSIGRDGERTDVVTKTAKPEIYVFKDTLIATAEGLLPYCDITKEIIGLTEVNTPMGRVVLVRARSDGHVQLGGPSITAQISGLLEELSADKIIVDGAISRKTLANPGVTQATVLCAGAALGPNMNKVIDETRHAVEILTLPKLEDGRILAELKAEPGVNAKESGYHYFPGAVSDAAVRDLILSNPNLKGVCLIAEDPSKIFLKPDTRRKLQIKEAKLVVVNPIRLVALAINPTSPSGAGFDPRAFLAGMQEAVAIPVYNVAADHFIRKGDA